MFTDGLILMVAGSGLLLPGYLAARALGLQRCWLVAFPLSALVLAVLVIAMALVGMPLRFGSMAASLLGFSVLCLVLTKVWRQPPILIAEAEGTFSTPRWVWRFCLGTASVIVLLVAFRATLFPLSGFDTYFRWEGLARAMLQQHSLEFYPPVTAHDFAIYVFPDGIPPLVATVYWWLYAAFGRPLPGVTALPVALQLASSLVLIYYATLHLFGRSAAWYALLAAVTSTLFINGIAIGQETGFTALSVAGQLCFAGIAVRNPQARLVVTAALFAGLGALAREYGPALALAGFSILAWYPQTRRYLLLFLAIAMACAAPWYLRNWALTGNPFYAHALPGGFQVNTVYASMLDFYKEYRSVSRFGADQWLQLPKLLCIGAPLPVLVGLPFAMRRWRTTAPLLMTVSLVLLLWLISVGQTAGGVVYSLRVLTPAFVALSICAGGGCAVLADALFRSHTAVRFFLATVMFLCAGYAAVSAAAHPFPARSVGLAFASRGSDPPEFCVVQPLLARNLQETQLPSTGVLTDDMYLATILQRTTRFRPVMIWSPEVSFVFDPQLSTDEIQRRLLGRDVRLVAIENDSPNTLFLMRYPFFQEYQRWHLMFSISDRAAMFLLPDPEMADQPGRNDPPTR